MIKTDIKVPHGYTKADILCALEGRLPLSRDEISDIQIIRRSLNISDKSDIHYDMTVGLSLSAEREAGLLKMKKKVSEARSFGIEIPPCRFNSPPLVVGAGPAGLFCALLLAEAGARPILIERGLPVRERAERVERFEKFGILDTECNVQFGEGGAGTFSDGKLKVGGMDKYKHKVLTEFVSAGAEDDILYNTSAHLGTDRLRGIVEALRERIVSLGGEVHFSTRLTDLIIRDGRVKGCKAEKDGNEIIFDTENIVLATGHSAADIFEMLKSRGAIMEAKGFGIGVRIEHPREYINRLAYGDNAPRGIETASYHLVTHLDNGRSVYSFCMCPGGSVVAATSNEGSVVTNGMSEYARSADNSNSALLVSVTPEDFGSDDVLAGIALQRAIERRAFSVAGGDYRAPAITLGEFMGKGTADFASVKPSYPRGTVKASPEKYLPEFITSSLLASVSDFDDWMGGFYYPEAVLTGPETRSTSPVRVLRGGDGAALGIEGLYPAGEGAGYAGGIVSSARDGLIIAEKIIEKHII